VITSSFYLKYFSSPKQNEDFSKEIHGGGVQWYPVTEEAGAMGRQI
jgi:hypothetical protein